MNERGLPVASVLADFLEPLLHHMLRLRGVYDVVYFEEALAFDVVVWRCIHPKVVDHLQAVIDGCKRCVMERKLKRVQVSFLDEEHRVMDQVCVSFAIAADVVDEKNAVSYYNWFRETLLVLGCRLKRLTPAVSFRVELCLVQKMADNRQWLLFADKDTTSLDVEDNSAAKSVVATSSVGQVVVVTTNA